MPANAVLFRARETPSSLSDEIRDALLSFGLTARRHWLAKGSMLSLHGGAQAGLHLLVHGRLKTLRFSAEGRVLILDVLDAGDVFGEMSILDGGEGEPVYAEALENAEIETVPSIAFERVLRARPSLALSIAQLIGKRLSLLERRLQTHVFQRVPTRLAALLLDLAERFGKPSDTGTVLEIALNQQDLGNLIGASREIVSLTLSSFRRRGAVSMRGRRIVVNRERLLREAATVES